MSTDLKTEGIFHGISRMKKVVYCAIALAVLTGLAMAVFQLIADSRDVALSTTTTAAPNVIWQESNTFSNGSYVCPCIRKSLSTNTNVSPTQTATK